MNPRNVASLTDPLTAFAGQFARRRVSWRGLVRYPQIYLRLRKVIAISRVTRFSRKQIRDHDAHGQTEVID